MRKVIAFASLIVLGMSFTGAEVLAENVSVQGYVRDSKTDEPLLGATVMLVGTSMGAATDMKGKYIIPNVPPGNYTIKVIYIGYEEWKSAITVATENFQQDFKLDPVGVVGTEVVVTAQAAGQNAAINQQLLVNSDCECGICSEDSRAPGCECCRIGRQASWSFCPQKRR